MKNWVPSMLKSEGAAAVRYSTGVCETRVSSMVTRTAVSVATTPLVTSWATTSLIQASRTALIAHEVEVVARGAGRADHPQVLDADVGDAPGEGVFHDRAARAA